MAGRNRTGKIEKPKDAKRTLRRIAAYTMRYRAAFAVLLVCTLASNAGNLLGPAFAGKAIGAAVGEGKIRAEDILRAFESGERALLGKTMPAKGLTLLNVDYGFPLFPRAIKE